MNILKENLYTFAAHTMYNLNHERHMHQGPMDLKNYSNRQLNTFFCTVLSTQYDTWSQKVTVFPFAFNAQVRTNMNLSPYELVFGQKPKRPIMFNLSSSTVSIGGNFKPSLNLHCNSFSKLTHTDHLGHHSQIRNRKLEKNFCRLISQS